VGGEEKLELTHTCSAVQNYIYYSAMIFQGNTLIHKREHGNKNPVGEKKQTNSSLKNY